MCWHRLLAVVVALAPLAAAGAAEFPYVATITAELAYARSGPGRNYYPTEKLPNGQTVEVYRRDAGGWLAIRPPQGSFSWVSSRQVKLLGEGLAEVTSDGAASHVGSSVGQYRDVVHARLRHGETVELIGNAQAGQAWYKIAPPAGEFRWIQARYVDAKEPAGPALPDLTVQRPPKSAPLAPIASAPTAASQSDSTSTGWQAARPRPAEEQPAPAVRPSQAKLAKPAQPEQPEQPWRPATLKSPGPAVMASSASASGTASNAAVPPTSRPAGVPIKKQLDEIDVALTELASRDASTWSLDGLNNRCQRLLDESTTAVDRGRSRMLLRKIERFAEIKNRHDLAASQQPAVARGGYRSRVASPSSIAPATDVRTEPARFDRVGRLWPVATRAPGDPPFALMDQRGQVVSYVAPTAGVNLRAFQGKLVGVTGTSSALPGLPAQMLSVERVTPLPDSADRTLRTAAAFAKIQ